MHTHPWGKTTAQKQEAARRRWEALRRIRQKGMRLRRMLERGQKRTVADALNEIRKQKL